MNLSDPKDNLRAFVKARASLKPVDIVTWFTGTVHSWMPAGKFRPVFGIEGYNVSKAVEVEGGYDLLTREAAFYTDLARGQPLQTWTNPFTEEEVDVVHIWNDPVNQQFRLEGPRGPWRVPTTGLGDDLFFNIDVFLAYPSSLPRADFPDNSQDDLYQAAELFQFFCSRKEVEDEAIDSAATKVSWTRLGPWLPFMKMADRPGQLVYHCRGSKLDSYGELPQWMRDQVDENHPEYREAPTEFTQPNETSWTYFKKVSQG